MEIEGYTLQEKIGQGGMAYVYKGYQISLKRPVAIKVLTQNFSHQTDFIQRFEKESLIIARLSNPFIIPVIERGISSDGIPYFIMEYVEGHELGKFMQNQTKLKPLNFNHKLDIVVQICKALSYAHRNNVIHRDIKPANVLIDKEGNARILDFGIAQYYDDEETEQTQVGTVMGTMAYMSPEQRRSATEVTFKSDIYSLGVLMYKLFTQHDPIGRFKAPEEILPEIPPQLSHIIMQCLENEPAERPVNTDEIKDSLLLLLRGAHLHTEQRERVQNDFKQFDLLDIIKEDSHSSVMLFQKRSSNKLIIIKKRALGISGFAEAKLLSPLKQHNIVNILGTSENQRNYIIVMEYLNGGNLQDRLVQPMKWHTFIAIAQDMTQGMEFAHQNRILHGNLRPSNVLFDQHGRAKLADFGLEEHYTTKNKLKNWYRLPKEKISPQMDIFSMGVIFYQMLVGKAPVMHEKRFSHNVTFKQLPLKLKQLISQMLEINPQERIANFSLVLDQLNDIAVQDVATIAISNRSEKKAKETKTKKYTFLFLSLLALLLLFLWSLEQDIIEFQWQPLQDLYYYLESLFFPAKEIPTEQPNFIELN